MIVSNNISPEKNLYYLGAQILKLMNAKRPVDILTLYQKVNKETGANFVLFTYALDWLYIAKLIDSHEEKIQKCL